MIDAVSRMIPGVLGTQASAEQDSFADGLLDCPHYTRPEVLDGMAVPKVLLSGNHSKISQYRQKQSLARTLERRPDLLSNLALTDLQEKILVEIVRESRELK